MFNYQELYSICYHAKIHQIKYIYHNDNVYRKFGIYEKFTFGDIIYSYLTCILTIRYNSPYTKICVIQDVC